MCKKRRKNKIEKDFFMISSVFHITHLDLVKAHGRFCSQLANPLSISRTSYCIRTLGLNNRNEK